MDDAERLLKIILADEGWSWERQQLQDTVTYADLAFCVFKPYINILDPGGPFKTHTITKEARHLNALYWQIKRQGQKPHLLFKDGTVFHPWKHYKRHIYSADHVEKHMCENEVSYYTSGTQGLGLIYMDVDAHKLYQTDEYDGLAALKELFPDAYYRASRRGQNQYLKVRYSSPEQFNALCDKVQEKLRLLFLSRGILCDFETKGKVTTAAKSGSLAKLPFTSPYPYNMRDETDAWNFSSLMRFHTSHIYTIEEIAQSLDSVVIDSDAAMAMAQKKEALERLERTLEKSNATEAQKRAAVEKVKHALDHIAVMESPQEALGDLERYLYETVLRRRHEATEPPQPLPRNIAVVVQNDRPTTRSIPVGIVVQHEEPQRPNTTGMAEGDAFARNWQVLPGFVRGFYRQHQRLPTTDDALAYLYENGLFSGQWTDGAESRRMRVASILEKIAEGFDESKLGTGEHQELNPHKFGWWVRQHFGDHMRATVEKRNCFDAETMTYPRKVVDVPLRFICGFLAAAEIAIAKTENGRVSTNWFKTMFKQMDIAWNQEYYMATRDKLHGMGVIQITDRHHKKNVAWKWGPCFNIPASWREEQRALKEKLPKGDPEDLPSSYRDITVYTTEDEEISGETPLRPPRPPPDAKQEAESWFDEACFEVIGEEGLSCGRPGA